MPWKIEDDLEGYKKGMTTKQKSRWVAVANSSREACIKDGGDPDECDAKAIKMANGVTKESINLTSDVIKLIEKQVDKNDTIPIKIIKPGWGSSGYYPEDVLKRDGPQVFKSGTQMYWDHLSAFEERDRPEGSLRNLAAVLASDAEWKNHSLYGAGLYAQAKIFGPYKDAVKELTPHIGVSIRASGRYDDGEADGRKGKIIEGIDDVASIDFVTIPGAGGKPLELFESYRDPDQVLRRIEMETIERLEVENKALETKLSESVAELDKKSKELETASAELKRQAEALLLKQSADFVGQKLAEVELPELTKKRLAEKLSRSPAITEDKKLDEVKFSESITKAVTEEKEYLAAILGSGQIKGMGESEPKGDEGVSLEESFKGLYLAQGMSDEKATEMAKLSGGK